mmetsp:Transcript_34482/g.75407  ORF Transcript_34482/g.75407 Transcript_34482/m.75407 type:complete len:593 (-) Transcript_34482:440-2218(-)|eukprot:CAMPEP_0118942338 /NCGR_PEP_ID=MMETSP1169-20130426/35993_1 /TAXON_ID=36882 /ORGANISM="Pyramimonas obovata, Strain CCMP722" /LENGTH=592 /DNA_ID=CAMNT_0006887345 /DNA_START=112 /DNA_END=1890 /DNA_ORIENTATION=+
MVGTRGRASNKRSKKVEDDSGGRQTSVAEAEPNDSEHGFTTEAELLTSLEQSDDENVLLPAIGSLEEFFISKLQSGEVVPGVKAAEARGSANDKWLAEKYASFKVTLKGFLGKRNVGSTVQCPALNALMECARTEQPGTFSNELYGEMLRVAVTGDKLSSELVGVLVGRYLPFADVRYHTWSAVSRIAEQLVKKPAATKPAETPVEDAAMEASAEDVVRNLYDIMANTPLKFADIEVDKCIDAAESSGESAWCMPIAEEASEAPADKDKSKRKREALGGRGAGSRPRWSEQKHQKANFSKAWLTLLQLPLPEDVYKKVLSKLHVAVMPHMVTPVLLSDFLTNSVNRGGLIGMLALNGIFILVQQHGLEYPQFYDRLYTLLEPNTFRARFRKRFFDLMDIFLRSPLLPAYIAAAFVKRFARHALTAPPAGAIIAIGFIHNLLRRHPSCNVLVHRNSSHKSDASVTAKSADVIAAMSALDPFRMEDAVPAKSNALKSSLWELKALQNHMYPQVVQYCRVLEKDLSERGKTTEIAIADTTSFSYGSIMQDEMARKMKRVPLAYYKTAPKQLMELDSATPEEENSFAGWDLSFDSA